MRAAEFRQSLRSLARSPWYALSVVGVLALGLALATTTFTIVDGVLFRPLPVPHASELLVANPVYALSLRDAREWGAALPETKTAAFQSPFDAGVIGGRDAIRVRGASIDAHFFDVLGLHPVRGGFREDDFVPAAGRLPAIISDALWRRVFGGRDDVVGQRLDIPAATIQGRRPVPGFVVAGVLPRTFIYPISDVPPDLLIPYTATPAQDAERNWGIGRLLIRAPAGTSIASIKARLDARIATEDFPPPDWPGGRVTADVRPIGDVLVFFQRANFAIIFGVAATLVLLTCVNAGGLGLARARQRESERVLRRALGANTWDLARLSLLEVAPLAVAGVLLGLLTTALAVPAILSALPDGVSTVMPPRVDWRVMGFAALAGALAVVVCGLAMRPETVRATPHADRLATPRVGRGVMTLVGVQVAIAFVLTLGGALLVGSLWKVWQIDPGFSVDETAFVEFIQPAGTAADREARTNAILDAARLLPGVDDVGALSAPFLQDSRFHVPSVAAWDREAMMPVSSGFFAVIGLSPIDGRLPEAGETGPQSRVLVVSAKAARDQWPTARAVGQAVQVGTSSYTVIGVVPDARFGSLGAPTTGQVYLFNSGAYVQSVLLLHGPGVGQATIDAAIDRARAIVPGIGVLRAMTVEQGLGASIRLRTARAWLFGTFGAAALVVIATGVLGLVAMTSSRRTREIGIRLALGATRARVVTTLVRDAVIGVGGGLVVGGLFAWWTMRLVKTYLYQSTVYDASSWSAAAALIVVIAGLGAIVPSFRAGRANPVEALRAE